MEARIAAAKELPFAGIPAGKFRRRHGVGKLQALLDPATIGPNARDGVRAVRGLGASYRLLRKFSPDVVFVMSFVGLPVGIAAHLQKKPLVIHELDFTLNLTNRTLSRWADAVAVGFPVEGYQGIERERLVFTGNPVRAQILAGRAEGAIEAFGLDPKVPVVLVTGGSQGARSLNDIVVGALPKLLPETQVIHLTGEGDIERVRFATRQLPKKLAGRYHPFSFLSDEMADALAASTVVVGRAGANTITELAALRKPTVLVPNYLHAGHQEANAQVLARAGAAKVLDERRLTPEMLAAQLLSLLKAKEERARLSEAIGAFAVMDAPERLARLIIATANGEVRHG